MKLRTALSILALLSVPVHAEDAKPAAVVPPATKCTPPDDFTVTLPLAKAIILNNILQDQDVLHKDWIDIARNVRAQLTGQCKENKH